MTRTINRKAWNSKLDSPIRESLHSMKDSQCNMFNPISKGNIQGVNTQRCVHLQIQNYLVTGSLNVWLKLKRMATQIPKIVTTVMMIWNSIKEILKGTRTDTQHQNNAHYKNSLIECDVVRLTNAQYHMVPIFIL